MTFYLEKSVSCNYIMTLGPVTSQSPQQGSALARPGCQNKGHARLCVLRYSTSPLSMWDKGIYYITVSFCHFLSFASILSSEGIYTKASNHLINSLSFKLLLRVLPFAKHRTLKWMYIFHATLHAQGKQHQLSSHLNPSICVHSPRHLSNFLTIGKSQGAFFLRQWEAGTEKLRLSSKA